MSERTSQFVLDQSYEAVLGRLENAVAAVRRRVNVQPSARVRQWGSAIERLARSDVREILLPMVPPLLEGRFESEHQDGFRALVEARMFIEIVEQLLPDLSDADLADLISGNVLPGQDHPSSRARDRQFELFVGAVCRSSGICVRLEEPDLSVQVENARYSIAAKRLRSRRKIGKNLRKATNQIKGAQRPGFIFADVTQLLDLSGEVITHDSDARRMVEGPMNSLIEGTYGQLFRGNRGPLVRGVVLRVAFPMMSEGFRFGTFEYWSVGACGDSYDPEVNRVVAKLLSALGQPQQ